MKYFQEELIEKTLLADVPKYIDYLKTRIGEVADGQKAWIKDKVIYDDPVHPDSGDIRSMTCFTDRVKVVKVISTNPLRREHYSVSVGATLLLHYEENFPIAVFDATMMSAIRTSAMAIISAQLAEADLSDTLIIGRGRVGTYMRKMLETLGYNPRTWDILDDVGLELLVHEAKVIMVATNSRQPFLFPSNCKADFVISVGADTHFNFELSDELILQRSSELFSGLYIDCDDALEVGDLSRIHSHDRLPLCGDMFDLYLDRSARTFISVGSPLMDALTIEYLSNELL